MLPKSHKQFVKKVAEKKNISETIVDDVIGFLYSDLRKGLTELRDIRLKIPQFGVFAIKQTEIPKIQAKYEKHLSLIKPTTFNQALLKKELEIRSERVKEIAEKIKDEKQRRKKFFEKKYEKRNSNLEEQSVDSGRDQKQSVQE